MMTEQQWKLWLEWIEDPRPLTYHEYLLARVFDQKFAESFGRDRQG